MKRLITIALLAAAACGGEPALDVTIPERESSEEKIESPHSVTPLVLQPQVRTLGPESDATKTIRDLAVLAEFYEGRFDASGSWLDAENAAAVRRGIARLNGDVKEYVQAKDLLTAAFDAAVEGSGPYLERANYHMSVHQLDAAHDDVEKFATRLILQNDAQAAVEGLRGDVAFHSGDLVSAIEFYERADELDPTSSSAGRLAYVALNTGDYDEAARLYSVASDRVGPTDPGAKAWAELHRGIVELERDDVAAALEYYLAADAHFGGWYLVQEHIAEAHLLLGEPEKAVALYNDVLARVPNGEFYAALGDTYAELGDQARADVAYANARDAFERDIALVASAASGHALDFYLGHAPQRALDLAEENFELRPGHEARTKLAQARYLNGDRDGAVDVLLPTTETEWATVDFMATAAVVLAQSHPDLAAEYAARAEAVSAGSVLETEALLTR